MLKERIFHTLLLTIILIISLNFFYIKDRYKKINANKNHVFTKKTHNNKKYDVIIYGDSRALMGISPKVLSDYIYSNNIINYSFLSASMSNRMMQEIKTKLDPNGKKIIVFGITPNSITPNSLKDEHFLEIKNLKKSEIIMHIYLYQLYNIISYFPPINIYEKIP